MLHIHANAGPCRAGRPSLRAFARVGWRVWCLEGNNVPDALSPIRWSGKYRPASVRITAYSRQTEAGVARALIARLKAAEFLALRAFEVGVDQLSS